MGSLKYHNSHVVTVTSQKRLIILERKKKSVENSFALGYMSSLSGAVRDEPQQPPPHLVLLFLFLPPCSSALPALNAAARDFVASADALLCHLLARRGGMVKGTSWLRVCHMTDPYPSDASWDTNTAMTDVTFVPKAGHTHTRKRVQAPAGKHTPPPSLINLHLPPGAAGKPASSRTALNARIGYGSRQQGKGRNTFKMYSHEKRHPPL